MRTTYIGVLNVKESIDVDKRITVEMGMELSYTIELDKDGSVHPYEKASEGKSVNKSQTRPSHKDGWIPCNTEMPEDGEDVLVTFEYFRYGEHNRTVRSIGISYTHEGEWSGFINGSSGWKDSNILAWQPLPTAYRQSFRL